MHTVWIIGLFFTVEIEINNNTETLKPFKEKPREIPGGYFCYLYKTHILDPFIAILIFGELKNRRNLL